QVGGVRIGCPHVIVVSLPSRGRLHKRTFDLRLVHMGGEDCDDRPSYLILNCEDILELAIVSLGPSMGACGRVDKLPRYAHAITAAADAPLQYIPHTQLAPNLSNIRRFALVLEA